MTDEIDATPAGAGEPSGVFDLDAAAAFLTAEEEQQEQVAEQVTEEAGTTPQEDEDAAANLEADGEGDENSNGADALEEGDENSDADQNDENAEKEAQAEPVLDIDNLKGDTKLRLRDGTEVTVSDMKRDIDELRNVRHTQQQLGQHIQQFNNAQAEFKQRVVDFQQTSDLALEVLKTSIPEIPEMPSESLRETDRFQYDDLKDARDRAVLKRNEIAGKMQAIQQEKDRQLSEAQESQRAHANQVKQWHLQQLAQKLPEVVKNPKLQTEVFDYVVGEGAISADELKTIHHHGVFLLAEKAMKYDKLMAEKPTPVRTVTRRDKPANPAPGTAGRRQTKQDAEASRKHEVQQRIQATGALSIEDAANLMTEMDV